MNERDTSFEYRQEPPPGPVRRFIKCFWFLLRRSPENVAPSLIAPDGCSELVLDLADPLSNARAVGASTPPAVRLIGQYTRPTEVVPTGRLDLVGVRFWGSAVHHLFGVDAGELRNRGIDLADVAPRLARELLEAVQAADSLGARGRALAHTFARHVPPDRATTSPVERAIREWHEAGGTLSVDEVCDRIGLGVRQIERRFRTEVGISPKRFSRIVRFQHALRALGDAPLGTWSRVAYRCGYADQSHLIRDFRTFAGSPPSRFLSSAESELAECFSLPV